LFGGGREVSGWLQCNDASLLSRPATATPFRHSSSRLLVLLAIVLPLLILLRYVIVKVERFGLLIEGVNAHAEDLIFPVCVKQLVDTAQPFIVRNALVDDIGSNQTDAVRTDEVGKYAERNERLCSGGIHFVVLKIRQQEVIRRLKLRHQREVPIVAEYGLDEERALGYL